MRDAFIQDILPRTVQPSQYLGSEVNRIRKDLSTVRLKMALAFPDLYEIGTSHFGMQILYHVLNGSPEIAAERVFAPGPDTEALLRGSGRSIATLESGLPLGACDIIGFSLLYELNYTNILTILDLAGIPFLAARRPADAPLIIAGGPCTVNPEPVAELFDAMVIGDGETVVMEMARAWIAWRGSGAADRDALLRAWSRIEGVYIPALYRAEWDETGRQRLIPGPDAPHTIRRAVVPDLNQAPFPDAPVVPFGKPVHDRLRLELARGCTRGCRFCQAGMIYRPVRERPPDALLKMADAALGNTGYEDLSLLSLSTGDYGCIAYLMEELMIRYADEHVAISLPSLRAGTLTPELMALIKRVRKTGFTIAPEAGSQRLRNVINKNITREDILQTVSEAFQAGWQVIKLYFMTGLPTETRTDLDELVDLVRDIRKLKTPFKRPARINVSVGTFIPKSHTPFQWCRQLPLQEAGERIFELKSALRMPNVQFKWQNPEISALEGLWARGDRRLTPLLINAFNRGCRFDGWSDQFRFDLWEAAMADCGIELDAFNPPDPPDLSAALPWERIDMGLAPGFLRSEYENAVAEAATPDCRWGACQGCGVCDFDTLKPVVYSDQDQSRSRRPAGEGVTISTARTPLTIAVTYAKTGPARYLGHLETVGIFIRALRRARLPLVYSKGFHPMPKVSFHDPLPVGTAALEECFYITVSEPVDLETLPRQMDPLLPDGLTVLACRKAPPKSRRQRPDHGRYRIQRKGGTFSTAAVAAFLEQVEWPVSKTNAKGKERQIDLKQAVIDLIQLSPETLEITLSSKPGESIRPALALQSIFSIPDSELVQVSITKLPFRDRG